MTTTTQPQNNTEPASQTEGRRMGRAEIDALEGRYIDFAVADAAGIKYVINSASRMVNGKREVTYFSDCPHYSTLSEVGRVITHGTKEFGGTCFFQSLKSQKDDSIRCSASFAEFAVATADHAGMAVCRAYLYAANSITDQTDRENSDQIAGQGAGEGE